ncbi:MAG: hypothetical protein WC121_08975 [Candidatus Kapaibacterium sp.]
MNIITILLLSLLFIGCKTSIMENENKLTGLWSLVVMDNYNEETNHFN